MRIIAGKADNGELGGDRTHDNTIKSRVLYQLSYELSPKIRIARAQLTENPQLVKGAMSPFCQAAFRPAT